MRPVPWSGNMLGRGRHSGSGRSGEAQRHVLHAAGSGRVALRVVQAGKPGGEPLDRNLELRVQINERTQLISEPRKGDFVVTLACLELFDPPVGEVQRQPKAASSSSRCCASWTLAEPTDGAEEAGRVMGVRDHSRPGSCSAKAPGRFSAMNGQAPWLAGSSCTQRISRTLSNDASWLASCLAGRG